MRSYTSASLALLAAALLTPTAPAQPTSRPGSDAPATSAPCDIYAAAGTPCVAAHSTTRVLYSRYRGPLYQVKRLGDNRTLDIAALAPRSTDGNRFADAAAQDRFCQNALCVINVIYDQSGKGNDLLQAAPGTFKGTAKGAFDEQPLADMAPVSLHGHKVYGVYIMPGMGMRNNNASYLAIGDEPQGIYYVVDGTHFDSGCCFDYGNASTNGRAVGTGTMDTTYFGTSTVWGKGAGAGPWLMTDMEAGLFSGHSAKENAGDPTIDHWRFVTGMVAGGGGNQWDLRGGDAQHGTLTTYYNGTRPDPNPSGGYFPMRRQGGILLGTGGDNGNGSSGTFYEGVMTTGHPTEAASNAVQANIVAARYALAPLSLSRTKTFAPGSAQDVTVTFTNPEQAPVKSIRLRLELPPRWSATASAGAAGASVLLPNDVAAGATVTATFKVTAPSATNSGYLTAHADWTSTTPAHDTATQRIRAVPAVKLNEARFSTASNPTDQFVELYNASDKPVDLSRWTLVHTPGQWATLTLASIPAGTSLAPHSFYTFGVAPSGLVTPTVAGATTLNVRSTTGLTVGQTVNIDGESRTVAKLGTAAETPTTIFIPVSTGPRITFPAGSTNLAITSTSGFVAGEKIGIDAGGHYEIATVSTIGKPATQTVLAEAASAGANRIAVRAGANISPGDTLTIATGQRKEEAKVATATGSAERWDVVLATPLKMDHMAEVDVWDRGTGITFTPATRFAHTSGDALQALGTGITLDRPLDRAHSYGAPIVASGITASGFQGTSAPNQWLGSPLSSTQGSLALMDATGTSIVDALVYGSQQSNSSANGLITTPELATLEGDQGAGGCIVVVPTALRSPGTSVQRYPDGADTDNGCTDFRSQASATVLLPSEPNSANLKVSSTKGFTPGQSILVGNGASQETATVATVGTPGAALLSADAAAGATRLTVASPAGFTPDQSVTIGTGPDAETATVAAISRRPPATVTLSAPLAHAHPSGTAVAGSGITLNANLKAAHPAGDTVASGTPTPGAPNR